jgi:hypothetical protein
MPSESDLPRESGNSGHPYPSLKDRFSAKLVLHLIYENEKSARMAGHRRHGYATASVDQPIWFQSKDSFMALVCKVFEQFYDEMKNGSDAVKTQSDDPPTASRAEG